MIFTNSEAITGGPILSVFANEKSGIPTSPISGFGGVSSKREEDSTSGTSNPLFLIKMLSAFATITPHSLLKSAMFVFTPIYRFSSLWAFTRFISSITFSVICGGFASK